MSKVIAFGYGLSKENKELITRMVMNVLEKEVTVIDLASYKFDVEKYPKSTIYLVFGKRAKRISGQVNLSIVRYFPEPTQLEPGGDEEARVKAWQDLLELKKQPETISEYKTLTEDSLPELTAGEIKSLEKTIRELGIKEWKGITKDGKSIRLTIEPLKEGLEDIKMTFSELYAVKMAMEILQIKEIDIVTNSENTSQ